MCPHRRVYMLSCPLGDDCLFFFNDTATTEIYTLSLHDALPIWYEGHDAATVAFPVRALGVLGARALVITNAAGDRKSTRLNSSHQIISYSRFCLKKNKHKRFR